MRKFKLYTYDKKDFIDLNQSIFATDPTGLGNAFQINYKDTEKGKYVANVKPNFENISLKIYFNADGTSGYQNYKSLANFLQKCGKSIFLFEYDDGITKKYTDVILKSAPKSEISEEGLFVENFTFERQSYWYEEILQTFSLKKVDSRSAVFPLTFPFGFIGDVLINEFTITNDFFEQAPLIITIREGFNHPISLKIVDEKKKVVSEIEFTRSFNENEIVIVDAENKKITLRHYGEESNAYSLTNKQKQSFLYIPQGTYTLLSNITSEDEGTIEVKVKKFIYD